ncbi:guanosine-3',5'-bis(diphosphate) 3'-pyrophosphohydrolase MESH1-like protein [Sarcoptes scabiei]|uniref:Guanosine-3',5'-bis(diphosphate) 3'-pyrophosphohydrolase MESH1 n=1 Tax=Sarcoptes scabiei TaxID=52283 RepID=A0A131ZZX3_SARSC|nr:guanosine-3',5'-bis(diphosphate) 3'-pyrophosphohydrolase MESH1-like protein [Sarcoptes scabiei]
MEIAELLMKATDFAAKAHRKQLRKDGETPYINHPIGVANILASVGKISDPNILISALLHDTVEDTAVTFDEIEKNFGSKVRSIVEELTIDKTLPKHERKQLEIENASKCCDEAKLIKMADKLHNLEDLLERNPIGWSEQRVQNYFEWSAKIIENLLNMNVEIENRCRMILSQRNVSLS